MATDASKTTASLPEPGRPSRRQELLAFLTLAVLIWPVIAVGLVGGYGFLIWMIQLVVGPPGPPR